VGNNVVVRQFPYNQSKITFIRGPEVSRLQIEKEQNRADNTDGQQWPCHEQFPCCVFIFSCSFGGMIKRNSTMSYYGLARNRPVLCFSSLLFSDSGVRRGADCKPGSVSQYYGMVAISLWV